MFLIKDVIELAKSLISQMFSGRNAFTKYIAVHNPKKIKALFEHLKESEEYELLLIGLNLACERCLNGLKTVDPDDKTSIAYLQVYAEIPNFIMDIVENLSNKNLEKHIEDNVKEYDKLLL